jgi:hypothetical protein
MVYVAQSGERRFVDPKVMGSKPIIYPNKKLLKTSAKGFGKAKIRSYIYGIRLRARSSLTYWKKLNALVVEW